MELTISTVILFQFIFVFCNGINPSTILNLGGSYDKILPGHGYKLLKVKTLEHCHRICLYSPKCLSVNWNIKTKYCQLNSEDAGTGAHLMMSTGDLYVPSLGSNIKNHACISNLCKLAEVCIPVKSAADFVCLVPDDQVSTTVSVPTMTTTPTTMLTTTTTIMATTSLTTTMTAPASSTFMTPTTTATQTTTSIPTTATKTTTTPETTSTRTTPTTTITTTTTPDCSTYSNSFTRIPGYAVRHLNNRTYWEVKSVSTCEQHCVQHTAFTCKSYEFNSNYARCNIMSFVKDDALSAWTQYNDYDYFQRLRQCDVIPYQP